MSNMSKSNGKEKKPDARKISRKLNLRQRRFIAEFTNPESEAFGNQTKAAELAGYSELAPGQSGYQVLKSIEVQREIERVMQAGGLTREKIVGALKNGLEAKQTKVFCQDGKVIYSEPLEDHPTQVRAAEVAGKLWGDFPSNREQDRMAALIFQQSIVVVPGGMPEPAEKGRKLRQLTD